MRDPFRNPQRAQLVREAQIGLSVVAIMLTLFAYVAFQRIMGHGQHLPDHVLNAPVAKMVSPNGVPIQSRVIKSHEYLTTQPTSQPALVDRQSNKFASSPREVAEYSTASGNRAPTFSDPPQRVASFPTRPLGNAAAALNEFKPPIRQPSSSFTSIQKPVGDSASSMASKPRQVLNTIQAPFAPNRKSNDAETKTEVPAPNLFAQGATTNIVSSGEPNAVPDDPFAPVKPKSIDAKMVNSAAPPKIATSRAPKVKDASQSVGNMRPKENSTTLHVNDLRSTNSAASFQSQSKPPREDANSGETEFVSKPSIESFNDSKPNKLESNSFGSTEFQPINTTKSVRVLPSPFETTKSDNELSPTLTAPKPLVSNSMNTGFNPFPRQPQMARPQISENQSFGQADDKLNTEEDFTPQTTFVSSGVQKASVEFNAESAGPSDLGQEELKTIENSLDPSYVAPATKNSDVSQEDGVYVARNGDSFWSIAQSVYGDGRYFRALYEYNRPTVIHFDSVKEGMRIGTPSLEELYRLCGDLCPRQEDIASHTQAVDKSYVTVAGDTLFGIASHQLGQASRYYEILELNSNLLSGVSHLTPLRAGVNLQMPGQ